MSKLLTSGQMRAIEMAEMESGAVTGLELMERAGQGVVDAVLGQWPDLGQGPRRAVVLCGPGNNGGDGFVIARLLKARGWTVIVFLYGDPEKLPPDAKANYERWSATDPVTVRAINPPAREDEPLYVPEAFDLLVDGLFGTGLMRPFGGLFTKFSSMREALYEKGVRVVAVDIPTGLCSDSGRILGKAIQADLTVTFHSAKLGHILGDGPATCGRLLVHDIGVCHRKRETENEIVRLMDQPVVQDLEKPDGNKFSHGHALVLAGGPGRTGAARLAARGALRAGAGLVTLGVSPAAQMEVATQITALMLKQVPDAGALQEILSDTRINALCLGPGLGLDAHAAALLDTILNGGHVQRDRQVVLDADALTLIAQEPARLEALGAHAVLTPHGGEFARLFPDIAAKLEGAPERGPAYSKVDATREAAARCGAVVLFKGPDTVIAHPDGQASVHAAAYDRVVPWLATAGAGDVLSGFVTGFLARGFEPIHAAETATWLHVECARNFGPGLIAEDLPEQVPGVIRALAGSS